jgi:recombination protein RecA
MEGKDATLICISQVREKIGISFGEKHYRTGGKALDFYTHQVCWLATTEKLKKTFRGQERVFGVKTKAKFKRSKVAKPFREADSSILFDYGLDDIGSMLDYLYGPKAKEYEWNAQKLKREEIVKLMEDHPENLELLQDRVEKDWLEIETAIQPERKKRW